MVKNPPANAGDARDVASTPGSGRSPGVVYGNPLQYSCLGRIPWTEEPGRVQSMGSQRVRHEQASDHISSVQFSRSVVSDSLQPHESQHARPPCPSPTPGVHSDSRPSCQ